ncbi:MAG: alpha/beta hydrolase [Acidobacteria bacterium]|nr:alpha/beta hydrolase [Acidobacteriota bacterium]
MMEIGGHLRSIPFSPQGYGMINLASTNKPDLSKINMYIRGSRLGDAYPYPEEFSKVIFPSLDGTPLVGTLGLHRDGRKRPGVVFCHGFHGSRNKNYIMEAALEAFSVWDYDVLAPDLRNFGESQKFSNSPTTGGWKEGQDVLGACRFLGAMDQVTSVAAVGYSLGACSVMNAAYQCRKFPYITGGALAWSGFASMEQMMSHISRRPPLGDPFFPIYSMFVCLSEMRRLEILRRADREDVTAYMIDKPFSPDYRRYIREIAAPYYGLSEEMVHRLSSPKEFISEVDVPLMMVHAEDDPVCPVKEMEGLFIAADGNPNVDVWVLPTGSHCAFKGFDEDWYWSVMRDFLDYWADRPEVSVKKKTA